MDHALTIVLGLLVQLLDLVVAAIAFIEGDARHLLSRVGITGPLQGALLIVLAVLLVVAALRVFGRLFAVLLLIVLVLLLLHGLVAGPPPVRA